MISLISVKAELNLRIYNVLSIARQLTSPRDIKERILIV